MVFQFYGQHHALAQGEKKRRILFCDAQRTFVFWVRFWTHPLLMTRSISKQPFWFTGATDVSRGKRLRRLGALFSQELRAVKATSCGRAAPC